MILEALRMVLRALGFLSSPLLGPLIISLVCNSIPFVSLPYLIIILSYAIRHPDIYDKLLIVISSALGASLGKLVIYTIGKGFSKTLSPASRRNAELFNKIAKKSTAIAIFIFAALPLPDDVLYLPLGISGFSVATYFIAVFLGKVFLKALVVFYGSVIALASESLGYQITPLLILASVIIAYYVIKIDWSRVLETHTDKGLKASIECFFDEVNVVSKGLITGVKTRLSKIL
ncbi:MAG: VTT domain-containing protein [Zestosphaera sp.]